MRSWRQMLIVSGVFLFGSVEGSFEQVSCSFFQRAAESRSDVAMILHGDKPICVYGETKEFEPLESRSVTKTFVGLAIGILFQEGYISSLDTPVYYFFPEWYQGNKKYITLRHLLNHTSGISTEGEEHIECVPDVVKFSLASDLSSYPGTHFIYNNKATNLLAAIVQKATGISVHEYLKNRLFLPLGITSDTWICDPSGNNYGMSHLTINAKDLAKVGLLLANKGCWNGIRLLTQEWIELMTQPSQELNPFYGLVCWLSFCHVEIHWSQELINQYAFEGVNPYYLRCLESLCGRMLVFQGNIGYGEFLNECAQQLAWTFGSPQDVYNFFTEIENKGLPLGDFKTGALKSFSARGFQGQKLIVFPNENVVVVRLAKTCGVCYGRADTFSDIDQYAEKVINECGPICNSTLIPSNETKVYTKWE